MKTITVALFLACGGCALGQVGNTISAFSEPAGADIYTQPVRFVYQDKQVKNALTKIGTTPTNLHVWGQGLVECWAVKDGKMLKFAIDPESQAPVQLDMSKARAMTADEARCLEGKIYVGMPEELLRISWGDPHDVNTTTTARGSHSQWVYKTGAYSRNYVYVEKGRITGIQN